MRITTALTAAAAVSLPQVAAWGALGHKTVALLASRYFLPETALFVQEFLYKDQTIMDAATWADRFAHVPFGRFSKGWHYIDAKDNPPDYCQVQYSRDCEIDHGCIVSAIVNMTARVNDQSLRWYDRSVALKFILHFIGDIHQPLHTENKSRGGNGIKVKFNGHDANLHSVWDGLVLTKYHGGNTDRNAIAFANALQDRIEAGGVYFDKKKSWSTCLNISDAETCSVSWAQSANDYICSYVLKEEVEGVELSGAYAEGALPIIESSVATAAWRLAGWLNMIIAGRDGLSEQERVAGFKVGGTEEDILRGISEEPRNDDERRIYALTGDVEREEMEEMRFENFKVQKALNYIGGLWQGVIGRF